ncbi:MAG: hypothetical protein ACM3VV_07315, partial [Deltaproteobacteria bacterium]
PLWISQATNYNNQPLGLRGAQKIIEEALTKAKLDKHKRLYLLRHSRATHLCKWFTESQMCVFFGWQHGTKVVRRYIHLSGKDLDNTLLSISEEGTHVITKQTEYLLKTRKCNRCIETLSPTQQFCGRCGLTTTLAEQYTKELDLERENKELKIFKEKQKQKDNDIEELKRSVAFLANKFNAFLLSQPENKLIYYEDDKKGTASDGRRLKGIELKSEINNKAIGTVIPSTSTNSRSNNKKS